MKPEVQGYLDGYYDGYMSKEAKGIIGTGLTAAVALPPLLGLGLGAIHSRLTSPTDIDKETVQRALLAAELDEALTDFKRQKAVEERRKKEQEKEVGRERSLRI